jgi:hypothetical protein
MINSTKVMTDSLILVCGDDELVEVFSESKQTICSWMQRGRIHVERRENV